MIRFLFLVSLLSLLFAVASARLHQHDRKLKLFLEEENNDFPGDYIVKLKKDVNVNEISNFFNTMILQQSKAHSSSKGFLSSIASMFGGVDYEKPSDDINNGAAIFTNEFHHVFKGGALSNVNTNLLTTLLEHPSVEAVYEVSLMILDSEYKKFVPNSCLVQSY